MLLSNSLSSMLQSVLGPRNLQRACLLHNDCEYEKTPLIEHCRDSPDAVFSQWGVFSLIIPVVSPKLYELPSNKIHRHTNIYCGHWSRESWGPEPTRTRLNIEFSNTYPLSNPAPGIVRVGLSECPTRVRPESDRTARTLLGLDILIWQVLQPKKVRAKS